MFGLKRTSKDDIKVSDAVILIEKNNSNAKFIILDVRTPEEYDESHIKGAKNINYNANDFKNEIGQLDKHNTYLVYCRSGRRSSKTINMMRKMGFVDIKNLSGGINAWHRNGFR